VCRTAAIFVFLPIPGFRTALETHRLALAVLFAFLLTPFARATDISTPSAIAVIACSEAALGAGLGLCVALMQEGIQLAAQIIGLQAGFSYSSTIDPTSNADSAILQVLFTLASSLLFLAMGFDTLLFRFLLEGAQTLPPGEWKLSPEHATALIALFPPLFTDAIRLALPVIAILLFIDITLALFSRVQPQLQLLSLSFPVKLLASMALVALGAPALTDALERAAGRSFEVLRILYR
jgi:flagellar biosynthesis protein FliR